MKDYTKASRLLQLQKTWTYIRLYGFGRTVAKVRSAFHLRGKLKSAAQLPLANPSGHVAIIGCGGFAFSTVAYYLRKNFGKVLRATMDIDLGRATSLCSAYQGSYATDKAEELLSDNAIDLVYIVSNHASHADYAIQALRQGKSVHIEKPPVVNDEQLEALHAAILESKGGVNLGYNRPFSQFAKTVADAVQAATGPITLNWFIAGHHIPLDHWYFDPKEGGRVLGNFCHWLDYSLQIIPDEIRFPVTIKPVYCDDEGSNIIVTLLFPNNHVANICFSAKEEPFDGISERLTLHRGDTLLELTNFEDLTVKKGRKTRRHKHLHRDHGHQATVRQSYLERDKYQLPAARKQLARQVWETANLMLRTKQAVENNETVVAVSYDSHFDDTA